MSLNFMDIEASSLLNGFPVEIGWAWESAGKIASRFLIVAPTDQWLATRNWDADAESVHGLTLNDLREYGDLPADICRRLNDELADQEVVFDTGAAGTDVQWLRVLYDAAQMAPTYTVLSVASEQLVQNRLGLAAIGEAELQLLHQSAPTPTHRAAMDASCWAWWIVAIDTCIATPTAFLAEKLKSIPIPSTR